MTRESFSLSLITRHTICQQEERTMKVPIIIHEEKLELSEYHSKKLKELVKENQAPLRAILETIVPESRQQRRFLHGGLIPLWVALDGNDWRDHEVCDFYFEEAKKEYSPEAIKIRGKVVIRAKSSKGSKALNKLTESLIDMLVEHYGLAYNTEVLKPDNYIKFRDELYMTGSWETYLDYAKEMKWW